MAIQDFTAGQVLTAAQMDSLQANDYNWTVSTKTASYVLVAADKGTRVVMNSASATTITVNDSLFSAGDILWIQNINTGTCTIQAGSCTVNTAGSLALTQWQGGTLYFTSASAAIFFLAGSAPVTSFAVDFLVVAGGAGGGLAGTGGGGGAGGMRCTVTGTGGSGGLEAQQTAVTGLNFSMTVGAGGAGGLSAANGSNSVAGLFTSITSTGGGYGARTAIQNGNTGGSGGGGSGDGGLGAAGTSGQGFAGGNGAPANGRGGGGGGASAVGAAATATVNGAGGAGRSTDISGASVTYAVGGSSLASGSPVDGSPNTGTGGSSQSGNGGSGVIILRYPDTRTITIGAGLTGTESAASGGYKRATITAGSGNVSWS